MPTPTPRGRRVKPDRFPRATGAPGGFPRADRHTPWQRVLGANVGAVGADGLAAVERVPPAESRVAAHTRLDNANQRMRPACRPTVPRLYADFSMERAPLDGAIRGALSAKEPQRVVRKRLPMRSHFSLVANRRRGSVNRSPQGAIRGGFAVSPQNSEPFARCACRDGALAGARRERRASAMSAAWDSSPALSPVPWGERNGEAFNCVPGG